jgi:hypothetical protein
MVKVHYNVRMVFCKLVCECVEWNHIKQDRAQGQAVIMTFMLP